MLLEALGTTFYVSNTNILIDFYLFFAAVQQTPNMDYLPIFANIKKQNCLVVGGGSVALRKINLLLSAKANITCIAKEVSAEVRKINAINIIQREFKNSDIDNRYLVISATNNKNLNTNVAKLAKSKNILVNVVDNPKLCSFIMPAIIDRNPIMIAVSSTGVSPVLSRLLRAKIESIIPASYGRLANIASEFRDVVKNKFSDIKQRRSFWEGILSGVVAEYVFSNQDDKARQTITNKLASESNRENEVGEVYLVGGGPGDPDLLTFKALRMMQQADVVLYDRLVSDGVLNLLRRDVEKIYVGKKRGKHSVKQVAINELLVSLASQGKKVCRLKGGDPFIFGRGGEEIEQLTENNIPFQVVPGITAASGCASYSGIPLTHRDYSQSCRFITGNLKDGTMNLPWDELVVENQTLIVYMGLSGAKYLANKLIEHNMRANISVALIEKGTTKEQKVYTTTLNGLSHLVDEQTISAPTIIIIGDVVKLRDKLNWYNN